MGANTDGVSTRTQCRTNISKECCPVSCSTVDQADSAPSSISSVQQLTITDTEEKYKIRASIKRYSHS